MRYMGWRPLDKVLMLLRIHDDRRQEQWTPRAWIPNGSMKWTGIGGDADWDELTKAEAEAVIEEFESNASAKANETLYTVSHDGEVLGTGLTADEVYNYVLDHQSHSYYYATKHGGWQVKPEVTDKRGVSLRRGGALGGLGRECRPGGRHSERPDSE